MHSGTMEIDTFDSEDERVKKGFDIPLNNSEYNLLQGMNRQQRRAWAKQNKRNK